MKYKVGDEVFVKVVIENIDPEDSKLAYCVIGKGIHFWMSERELFDVGKKQAPRAGLRPVEWVVGSKKGTGYFHKFDMGVAVIECENGNVIYTGQLRFTDVPEADNES